MSMDNVYYNLVINGAIKREKVPYSAVLIETGLKDTVGLNQTNWVEWFPPRVEVPITAEQIGTAVRAAREVMLTSSDWTDFNKEEVSLDERSSTKRELDSSELINLYQIKNKDAKILDRIAELQKKLGMKNEELEEELISERRYMVTDYYFSDMGGQVGLSVVVDAANEDQAEKKALDKIEKLRDSPLARRKGVDDPTDMGMDVEITNKPLTYTDIEKDTRS